MSKAVARPGRITVCYPLAGETMGGSHNSLLGLLQGLDQARFRILVVVDRPDGPIADKFRAYEQVVDPVGATQDIAAGRSYGPGKFLKALSGVRRRIRILREHGVSVVHTNDGRSHAAWAVTAKLAGCKLVWHHRADPTAKGLRYLAPLTADKIVTVSQFSLPRTGSSKAVREAQVVFSPFDTDIVVDRQAMREALISELAAPSDSIVCGYFGSFISRKRPLLFIEAIARMRDLGARPVIGVMFGEAVHSELEHEMRAAIQRLDLQDHLKIMGFRAEGYKWIAACDILMVPAVDEPLGRTLVEAMVVGTPVVATRSGGNPEAIGGGRGVLVEPEDAGALAEACLSVASDPVGTAEMTARAKQDAPERFSSRHHVRKITEIYDRLAG